MPVRTPANTRRATLLALLGGALLVRVLVLTTTRPASAQAQIQSSEPADGANVPSGLTQIVITFTSPVSVDQSTAQLQAAGQTQLIAVTTLVDKNDPRRMTIQTASPLSDGQYSVSWHAGSGPGTSNGQLHFTVGTVPQGATQGSPTTAAVTAPVPDAPAASANSGSGLTLVLLGIILVLAAVAIVQAIMLARRGSPPGGQSG